MSGSQGCAVSRLERVPVGVRLAPRALSRSLARSRESRLNEKLRRGKKGEITVARTIERSEANVTDTDSFIECAFAGHAR